MELIGIPHRLVISERGLAEASVEYKHRRAGENRNIALGEILAFLANAIPD
jgi:prolyl-tRNA synthetase